MASRLMGILNVTPDSFFDKGRWGCLDRAIERGVEIFRQGADIIDIGGESTRPGATPVSLEDELERVIPVIIALKKEISIPISIDTMKPKVAEAAILAGASLINDVSGFRDPDMRRIAAEAQVPICVMHMLENPQTMQKNPFYSEGVITTIIDWLKKRLDLLFECGIKEDQIIIDPGIGFGKTVVDNQEIIQNLDQFKTLGFPILIGASRKSFLGKLVDRPVSDLLAATLTAHMVCVLSDIDIIRAHDVAEHRDMINLRACFQIKSLLG
jgi:dihydropteroate synthase